MNTLYKYMYKKILKNNKLYRYICTIYKERISVRFPYDSVMNPGIVEIEIMQWGGGTTKLVLLIYEGEKRIKEIRKKFKRDRKLMDDDIVHEYVYICPHCGHKRQRICRLSIIRNYREEDY